MRLPFVVVEENARRAMHLADDHTFGAIDDERAVVRHERHVAHVNRLFLDVANGAGARILVHVPHNQTQDDLQRRGIIHAPLNAFLNIVFRLFKLVIDELQAAAPGEVVDREDATEHFLQSRVGSAVGGDVHLQKALVAGPLHVDQVGHRRHFGNPAEALAYPLARRECLSDCVHQIFRPILHGAANSPATA